MSSPRIVLFSGLALPPRFLWAQQAGLRGVITPPWRRPLADESLAEHAARVAADLQATPDLEGAEDLWLGGVSFGGMLALEVARRVPCNGVLMISSCRAGSQLAPWLQAGLASAARLPDRALRAALAVAPLGIRVTGRPDRRERRFLLSLVPHVDLAFARWGAKAILAWCFEGRLKVPVYHLHGTEDHLIPLGRVHPTAVVREAGHAMNVTHAALVNDWIGRITRGDRMDPAAPAVFEKSR